MSSSACVISISATMATLIMGPLAMTRMTRKRGCPQTRFPYLLAYWTPPLLKASSDKQSHGIRLERASHTFLPQMSFSPIFQSWFFHSMTTQPKHCLQPYISIQSHIWPFSFPRKMYECGIITVLPPCKNSASSASFRAVPERIECYGCPLLGGTCASLSFTIVLKVLATEIRQKTDMKWYKWGRKKNCPYLQIRLYT